MIFCIYRVRQGWSPGGRPRSCRRKLRSRSREVWRAKHPWGRRGSGMGNRAAGWSDRKEPLLQDSRGPSQMGRLSPCPAPASLHHVHKGARWGANLGHSLCRPPFVSCQGPEWSGEAWPGVPSTGCSGPVSLSQASPHRSTGLWSWGWLRSCKVPPRPTACPWGPPRQCSIHSSVLPVELWLSKVGATGPPHQSVMMGHALGDQWVPQARCLLSQLESLQVLQGHVVAEVVLILGKEGTLSSDHPPAKEEGGQ